MLLMVAVQRDEDLTQLVIRRVVSALQLNESKVMTEVLSTDKLQHLSDLISLAMRTA